VPSHDDVIRAANRVFLRFGFRRTTMGDIADEARMSRPALYLVFPSKQQIFAAVLARALDAELDEIRTGVAKAARPRDKLLVALDIWCVRNYELTHASAGAQDLYDSSFEVAGDVASRAGAAFDAIVAEILAPLVAARPLVALSAREIARLISSAIVGFKATAKNAKQLRATIRSFVAVILASLGVADV
jgi:AcrR family transcriptional regulator